MSIFEQIIAFKSDYITYYQYQINRQHLVVNIVSMIILFIVNLNRNGSSIMLNIMTFKINKINVEDQLFSYTRVEI